MTETQRRARLIDLRARISRIMVYRRPLGYGSRLLRCDRLLRKMETQERRLEWEYFWINGNYGQEK